MHGGCGGVGQVGGGLEADWPGSKGHVWFAHHIKPISHPLTPRPIFLPLHLPICQFHPSNPQPVTTLSKASDLIHTKGLLPLETVL